MNALTRLVPKPLVNGCAPSFLYIVFAQSHHPACTHTGRKSMTSIMKGGILWVCVTVCNYMNPKAPHSVEAATFVRRAGGW